MVDFRRLLSTSGSVAFSKQYIRIVWDLEGDTEEWGEGRAGKGGMEENITYGHSSALAYVVKVDCVGNPRLVGDIVLFKAD